MANDIPSRDELLRRAQPSSDTGAAPSYDQLLTQARGETPPQGLGERIGETYKAFQLPDPGPMLGRIPGAAGELWRGVTGMDIGEAGSRIASLGQEVPRYILGNRQTSEGSLVGNFFRALVPIQGREAQSAFLGQVGDIATAATGGLMGPLGTPRGQLSTLRRGMDLGPPPSLRTPDPRAALPSPRTGVPGEAPVSTGQGYIPEGPRGTVASREGLPSGPPSPLVQAPPGEPSTIQMEQPQRLMLPPPQTRIPGAPPIETGVGRPSLPYPTGSIRYTPPPGSGQIPWRQGATMPTYPPGAAPPIRPGVSFTGAPGRTSAEIAGTQLGRDLPPRAPGTEGRTASLTWEQAEARARGDEPMVSADAKLGEPPTFATALVRNEPGTISTVLAKRFRQLTGYRGRGPQDFTRISGQNQRITTAVDSIIENRSGLRLTDDRGNVLPDDQMPGTLRQFSDAIDQLKEHIYDAFDRLAGGVQMRVSLQPAIDKLSELIQRPAIRGTAPEAVNIPEWAAKQIEIWQREGSFTPREMQNYIREMNAKLEAPIVAGSGDLITRNQLQAEVLKTMRNTLNDTMMQALGGNRAYQALRNRYGALSEIEGWVGNALRKELAKRPGGNFLDRAVDWGTLATIAHGVAVWNPHAVSAAFAAEGSKIFFRYMRGENRAVRQLFNQRKKETDPGVYQRLTGQLSSRIPTGYLGPTLRDEPLAPPLPPPYVGSSGM